MSKPTRKSKRRRKLPKYSKETLRKLSLAKRSSGQWVTYDEAKVLLKNRGIDSRTVYWAWMKETNALYVPIHPDRVYDEWVSWSDFLGCNNVFRGSEEAKKVFVPYWEAVRWVHTSGIKGWEEWKKACREGRVPSNIPHWPNVHYKKDGFSAEVWFGKDLVTKVEVIDKQVWLWSLVRMEGEPENVVWFLKVRKEDLRTEGWKVMKVWQYEEELEGVAWDIITKHSSEYFEREQRLCPNIAQLTFALDSKLLIVRV